MSGDFGGAFGGFGFDDEGVRAPGGDSDVVGAAEFAGGGEPRGIGFAGEKGHGLSIGKGCDAAGRSWMWLYLNPHPWTPKGAAPGLAFANGEKDGAPSSTIGPGDPVGKALA